MKRCAVWIVIVLLLPSAAAQLSGPGGLTADRVSGTGAVDFHASLVAMGTGFGSVPGIRGGSWHLEASSIDTLRETRQATVHAPPAFAVPTDAEAEPTAKLLEDARVFFHDLDPEGYVVVVGADAGMHVQAGSLDIGYAGRGTYAEPDKQPDQQEPISGSWAQALVPSSAEATITVTGSFTIAAWGPTFDVDHAEGNETWQSGPHNERAVDPDGNVAVVDETWMYFDVRDGRLTIADTEIPEGSLIAAEGGALAVGGSLQAQGAVGRVLGRSLEGDDVTISGSLQADDLSVQGGRLAFTLIGTADSYVLDGRLIAVSPEGNGVSWLWAFAAVPVIAAWLVRRQQPARRVERLGDALGRGHFDGVLKRAPRFYGTKWDKSARTAAAIASLRLEAPEQALDILEEGDVSRGMTCFLRAHAHAIMGHFSEARALLREALETEPHLRPEAERNPALAPLLVVGSSEAYV